MSGSAAKTGAAQPIIIIRDKAIDKIAFFIINIYLIFVGINARKFNVLPIRHVGVECGKQKKRAGGKRKAEEERGYYQK